MKPSSSPVPAASMRARDEAASGSGVAAADPLRAAVALVGAARDLDEGAAERAFTEIASGRAPEVLIAALLMALKTKGETPHEIAGAARAYRAAAVPFERPSYLFADCCGTGGDGRGTINVSTAAALVAASAGLPVAKHGNRSISSRSGSADVLEALGAVIELPAAASRRLLDDHGLCFFFAPQYHPGARHAAGVRRALGVRTIMNLLGPISNPARPPVQLAGVYDAALIEPVARTLALLGCESALVVHGGGLDEIALHAVTHAALVRGGVVERIELRPSDAGFVEAPIDALRGGSPEENARLLAAALRGRAPAAHLAAIALNAGALLWIAGLAPTFADGASAAMSQLDSGRAYDLLVAWITATRRLAAAAGQAIPERAIPARVIVDQEIPGKEPSEQSSVGQAVSGQAASERAFAEDEVSGQGSSKQGSSGQASSELASPGLVVSRQTVSAGRGAGIGGVLGEIVAHKREEVARRERERSMAELRRAVTPTTRSLRRALARPGARFVLEHKRASPSKGDLRASADPRDVARAYAGAADAVSVLTDARFFGGSFDDLRAIREAIDVPLLCKDFVVSPYQVVEARVHGADAILVMLSVLDDAAAAACLAEAHALGMDALVEVHDEHELRRALRLPAPLLGINHRDLRTLAIDLSVSERLAPLVPSDRVLVGESGIERRADVDRLAPFVDAFLVGSSLMRAPDVRDAARALVFGRVKVCGLTTPEDARLAAQAGAALGGLVFAEGSPRRVTPAAAEAVAAARALPLAGVFVNDDLDRIAGLARDLELMAVQLHGDETEPDMARLRPLLPAGCAVWKVARLPAASAPRAASSPVADTSRGAAGSSGGFSGLRGSDVYTPEAPMCTPAGAPDRLVFDTASAGARGGSGVAFDWALVAGHPALSSSLLAGGIGPDNAVAARAVGAWALDVGSRLDAGPGRKDPGRVAQLFEALRGPCRASGSPPEQAITAVLQGATSRAAANGGGER